MFSLIQEQSAEAGPVSPELPEPTEKSLQEGESASKVKNVFKWQIIVLEDGECKIYQNDQC